MQKIKPIKYELSLTYQCPKCLSEYNFNDSELNKGFRWYCGCGEEFLIEKIYDIKLGLCYKDTQKPNIISESNFIEDATRYVFAMGYNKDLIKGILYTIDTTQYNKKEDLIRAILAKVDDHE